MSPKRGKTTFSQVRAFGCSFLCLVLLTSAGCKDWEPGGDDDTTAGDDDTTAGDDDSFVLLHPHP